MTDNQLHVQDLYQQLAAIEPGGVFSGARVFPCSMELFNGDVLDCVYVLSLTDARRFRLDPDGESDGIRWVKPETVRSLKESPLRLPARFASELVKRGESGMGYWAFTVTFSWWRKREYVQAFVDFIEYPPGLGPTDVKSVKPHLGTRKLSGVSALEVFWCAFEFPVMTETEFTIPAGAGVYLGAPAWPLPASITQRLAEIVSPLTAVTEAHLPQYWAPSAMNEASQILVVALDEDNPEAANVREIIKASIAGIFPPGQHLDVWFVKPDHSFLGSIRNANCRIK